LTYTRPKGIRLKSDPPVPTLDEAMAMRSLMARMFETTNEEHDPADRRSAAWSAMVGYLLACVDFEIQAQTETETGTGGTDPGKPPVQP